MRGRSARAWGLGALACVMSLSGCGAVNNISNAIIGPSGPAPGQAGSVSGFLGGAVADEPQAALTGRSILSSGGNAADAATAMAFMLTVTLPSRAGLGAGGGCLVYATSLDSPNGGEPEALMFPPVAPSNPGNADRPASVPMLPRALFALHAKYGKRPFETLIGPAEQAARFGLPISRALATDLAVVAGPLSADPGARAVFFANGRPLAEGGTLLQPDLGSTISQMRTAGVGDMYQGNLARRLDDAMDSAGGGLKVADMRAALPRWKEPLTMPGGNDTLVFLPLPIDGGVATAGAMQVLNKDSSDVNSAQARALGLASAARAGANDSAALLAGATPASTITALPASTSFAALDKDGNAVVCSISMGNLFGTGRMATGTGMLMAVSPTRTPQPILSAVLAFNPRLNAFRGMAGGSGQQGAPVAAAYGLLSGLVGRHPANPPEPGRANVIACPSYLPKESQSCGWSTDPRGYGLAVGSN